MRTPSNEAAAARRDSGAPASSVPARALPARPLPVRVLLVVAAVASLTWLWGPVLNPAIDPMRAYVSELAAADQPHRRVFMAGDLVMGLCLAVAGVLVWRRASCSRRRWGGAGFLVSGLATVVDALSPMDCSPSLSATCEAAEEAGRVSFLHTVHGVSSVAVVVGQVMSMVLLTALMGRGRRAGWVLVWAWALCYLLTLLAAVDLLGPLGEPSLGLWQRLGLLLGSAWWVWLALDRDRPAAGLSSTARSGDAGPRPAGSRSGRRPGPAPPSGCP